VNLQAFLAELYSREVQLRADGDRLRCNAPAGALTNSLREQLAQHKSEILAFLRTAEAVAAQPRAIVPLQPMGTGTPVFAVAGHNGDVFAYRTFAQYLGSEQPFYGLEPPGLDGESAPLERVEDIAAYFVEQVRTFRGQGPYIIAGYCAGGAIAYELARQLKEQGARIRLLALLAAPYPSCFRFSSRLSQGISQHIDRVRRHLRTLAYLSLRDSWRYFAEKLGQRKMRNEKKRASGNDPVLLRRARVARITGAAVARYKPGTYDGRVSLILPNKAWVRSGADPLRWRTVAPHAEEYFGPKNCNPDLLLLDPDAPAIAALFRQCREAIATEAVS
jgi:thioesterase domain-containing protein